MVALPHLSVKETGDSVEPLFVFIHSMDLGSVHINFESKSRITRLGEALPWVEEIFSTWEQVSDLRRHWLQ